MTLSTDEQMKKAREALSNHNPKEAFLSLRWVLEYPNLEMENTHEKEAFSLFAQIGEKMAGKEFAKKVWMVVEHPELADAWYQLGYELIEEQLPGIAATVLARAHRLLPEKEGILTELSIALEDAGQHFAAYLFLKKAEKLVQTSFFCRYLLAFNALMCTKIDEANELFVGLEPLSKKDPSSEHAFMLDQLQQMLQRAEIAKAGTPLHTEDLRGWHFVITGGILLHLSPFGFDEGMHGRYAFTQDSDERCKEAILRLQVVLQEANLIPPHIFLLNDRNSNILGHAVSRLLQIPTKPWPENGTEEPGMIVAYDMKEVGEAVFHSLEHHRKGQILFCHAAKWTEVQPIVGDITTYLYQTNQTPWGVRFRLNQEDNKLVEEPALTEPAEELAKKVIDAQVVESELANLPILQKFVHTISQFQGKAQAGIFCTTGHRRRQRTDSPVKSNRFL